MIAGLSLVLVFLGITIGVNHACHAKNYFNTVKEPLANRIATYLHRFFSRSRGDKKAKTNRRGGECRGRCASVAFALVRRGGKEHLWRPFLPPRSVFVLTTFPPANSLCALVRGFGQLAWFRETKFRHVLDSHNFVVENDDRKKKKKGRKTGQSFACSCAILTKFYRFVPFSPILSLNFHNGRIGV